MTSLTATTISSPNATVLPGYDIYFINTSNNSVNLTLPVITGDGMHFVFRNIDTNVSSNITTITPGSGNTIEGQSSYQLATGTFNHFLAHGTNWFLIG
jgi:hypothetical protein